MARFHGESLGAIEKVRSWLSVVDEENLPHQQSDEDHQIDRQDIREARGKSENWSADMFFVADPAQTFWRLPIVEITPPGYKFAIEVIGMRHPSSTGEQDVM
jgi:hypothetical protein